MINNGLTTYRDTIDLMLDFIGSNATADALRHCRQAVQDGYRELVNAHPWSYYYRRGRQVTSVPYTTGTVQYQVSTGPVPRALTLTGGTWPSWAEFGSLFIPQAGFTGSVVYEVARRVDNTTLQIAQYSDTGQDLAAGMAFTLFQDTYLMPADMIAIDRVEETTMWLVLRQVHPRDWLRRERIFSQVGVPRAYSIVGEPEYYGALALKLAPPPDRLYVFDFMYRKRARPLSIEEYKTGTISMTIQTNTASGTGTNWTQNHVGTVIRTGQDSLKYPTPLYGENPYVDERVIMQVLSPTSIVVDSPWSATLNNVKYVLGDPVDIERGAMLTAFNSCCRKRLATIRNMKTVAQYAAVYSADLHDAKTADARYNTVRIAGSPEYPYPLPLWDRTMGGDIP